MWNFIYCGIFCFSHLLHFPGTYIGTIYFLSLIQMSKYMCWGFFLRIFCYPLQIPVQIHKFFSSQASQNSASGPFWRVMYVFWCMTLNTLILKNMTYSYNSLFQSFFFFYYHSSQLIHRVFFQAIDDTVNVNEHPSEHSHTVMISHFNLYLSHVTQQILHLFHMWHVSFVSVYLINNFCAMFSQLKQAYTSFAIFH